jgi:hypothetical protein
VLRGTLSPQLPPVAEKLSLVGDTCRGRAIGQEDRDGYRLKDKNGRPIICYNCDEAASAPKHRRIVSCDFCDQHWHLDCLDPPMSGMPPPTRKWMCPLHADPLVPRRRQTKSITTQTVDRPYRPNNGDIIILPHQEARAGGQVEEMTVNRVRYQLPEQTVVLDFWNRVTGQKVSGSSSKKSSNKARVPRKRSAGYDSGDMSSLSELTSSDESESEVTGRSSSRKAAASSTTSGPASALDSLAFLAEVRYVDLLNSQQGSSSSVVNGTPGRDAKGKGPRDLPPAVPNSIQRRGPRPSAPIPAAATAAQGAKRTSIGPSSSAVGTVAPAVAGTSAGTSARSRGGSPSLSPAPRSSELVVETKEDLQALMRIRKLTKTKDAEGDQWRSTLFGFLEGEPILVSPIFCRRSKHVPLHVLTRLSLARALARTAQTRLLQRRLDAVAATLGTAPSWKRARSGQVSRGSGRGSKRVASARLVQHLAGACQCACCRSLGHGIRERDSRRGTSW